MNEYDELMSRYGMLRDDWMRRVDDSHARLGEGQIEFCTPGILLRKDGTLQMVAHDPDTEAHLWWLTMAPGDTQVTIAFPDGTTYQV